MLTKEMFVREARPVFRELRIYLVGEADLLASLAYRLWISEDEDLQFYAKEVEKKIAYRLKRVVGAEQGEGGKRVCDLRIIQKLYFGVSLLDAYLLYPKTRSA